MTNALGPWGFLPFVVPLFALIAARLGALAFLGAPSRASDRAVAGVVLAFASVVVAVRGLAVVHAVTPVALLAALVTVALPLALAGRRLAFALPRPRVSAGVAGVLVVAAAALALAALAARWLPVWQWDSLGYHLPFVHFTLGARGVDGVPRELQYIGSYPHDVELFFVALRACLPDDRLIDLGQLPFGLAGGIVTAALARRGGATPEGALGAGAAWLVVPAVFLQLPTNYVDVATAAFFLAAIYFALAAPSPRAILLAGVALGLFVGSKPSAPAPALVLALLLAVRASRAGHAAWLTGALGLACLLGGESYASNLVTHRNPIWPVRVDLGPLHFPGPNSLADLLAAGANAPRLTGPLPWRMLRSFFALSSAPVFDMRVGGFGPVFLCSLPLAILQLVRQKSRAAWVAFAATLLSPDPAIARYVLALPALALAGAAARVAPLTSLRARTALWSGVAVLAAAEVVYAAPGLSGEGPPLWSYATMSDAERALAVGADGPPLAIARARQRVAPGEAFAFDENMDLCDQAWDLAQSYRVVLLPPALTGAEVGERIRREGVRVLAVGDDAPAGAWAASHPSEFERLSALPECRKGSCSLYARR